jgi:hypothetical protein
MNRTVTIHPDDQDRLHAWATDHGVADRATAISMLLDAAGPDVPEDPCYRAHVDEVAAQWQHLIDALRAEGVNADLQQTGGMCFAVCWDLAVDGSYAMLPASHGPLSHRRTDEPDCGGYAVGVYLAVDDDAEATTFLLPGCRPACEHDDARAARYAVALARAMFDAERPAIA